jgi:hypothetical protein
MFSVSLPGILGMLAIIATILVVLGFNEKNDLVRRIRLLRSGVALIGLTLVLTGFLWYAHLALIYIPLPLYIEDIIILTLLSTCGGVAMGIALTMKGS